MKLLWMWLSVCSFLIWISFSVSEDCSQKNACRCVFANKTAIDLTSVSRLGAPRFFEILGDDNATKPFYRYSYNPCYPFTYNDKSHEREEHAKPCIDAAVCAVTPGSNTGGLPKQKLLGSQTSAVFFVDASETAHVIYSVTVDGKKSNVTVDLICNSSSTDHHLHVINETHMILTSMCACPGVCAGPPDNPPKSDDKLSTGSILLITFLVIILVYVGLGILYNFCNGAQGMELLPNIEFWSDLPKLIMEGVFFTCSCFGRRQSYADM